MDINDALALIRRELKQAEADGDQDKIDAIHRAAMALLEQYDSKGEVSLEVKNEN